MLFCSYGCTGLVSSHAPAGQNGVDAEVWQLKALDVGLGGSWVGKPRPPLELSFWVVMPALLYPHHWDHSGSRKQWKAMSTTRAREVQGHLSTALTHQHGLWAFTSPLVVTQAVDINTDTGWGRAIDPDMTLSYCQTRCQHGLSWKHRPLKPGWPWDSVSLWH